MHFSIAIKLLPWILKQNKLQRTLFLNYSTTEEQEEETTDSEDNTGFNAESFLLEIYQTAEQGVAFLSSLLDLPNKLNTTKPATEATTVKNDEETTPSATSQRRAPKYIKHPNQLW